LTANIKAWKFYTKLGYQIDATSPSQYGENVDYEIMSKDIRNIEFLS
jgi:ribosomal protein S18 acetylase RimI-like enzyme